MHMSFEPLVHVVREADGEPDGALILLHGRGADEHDLFPLLDALDPERRLHGYTPRAPLSLPPGGAHWYHVPRVGYPDPETFAAGYGALTEWFDALPYPAERVALGGFSQGAVMTYALGLGHDRPRPAALLALSGFVPTVPGLELDLEPPLSTVAIGHGGLDPIISVEWARRARALLEGAGAEVLYRETPVLGHGIDPAFLPELAALLHEAIG